MLVTSCINEDSQNVLSLDSTELSILSKDEIGTASIEDKLRYKRHHLKVLTSFVLKQRVVMDHLMKSNEIQHSDGLQIFLVEKLVDDIIKSGQIKISNNELNKIENSLDAFKGLEGESWYPIIYLRNNSFSEFKNDNEESRTFVAIEDADESGEFFTAYELLDSDGGEQELLILDDNLTPEFVGTDDLIVIELTDCDDTIHQYQPCSVVGDDTYNDGISSGGSSSQNLVLEKIKIKDLKEGWPGRSEISLKIYKLPEDALIPPVDGEGIPEYCGDFVHASDDCTNYQGRRYMVLRRSNVNREFEVNWIMKDEGNDYNSDDIIFYVIFEADSWPAVRQTATFDEIPNITTRISFRSWQGYYDRQMASQSTSVANNYGIPYANALIIDNSDIKYNFTLK